jgi:proton-dependent oligopeptide transporter, POT family
MSFDRSFFGHPRGLATLFFTEMWERFSYYGMRALLLLFMVASVERGGMGFDDRTGGAIYGLYTMFVYLLALPGGWLADKLFGLRKSIFYGGCIIAAGHFCLALPYTETFFVGLLFIVTGTGLLKPNISSMVGELYGPEDQVKRDNGFSIFYMGINIGALISPIICGYLGQRVNWHYGFAAAGIGMVIGLIQYKLTEHYLGQAGLEPARLPDKTQEDARVKSIRTGLWIIGFAITVFVALLLLRIISIDPVIIANAFKWLIGISVAIYFVYVLAVEKLDLEEKKKVIAIAIIFVITAMFYTGYEGQGSTLNLFAERYTDMFIGSFEMPASWLQSLPPVYVIIFVPVFTALWFWLSKRKLNPTTPVKLSLGLTFMGLGYVAMIGASYVVIAGDKPLPTWLFLTYMLHTFGEICLYPIGLSGITKLSPKRLVGRMMGVFFMALALGNLIAGLFTGDIDENEVAKNPQLLVDLFQFISIMMMVSAAIVLIISKPLRKLMGDIR